MKPLFVAAGAALVGALLLACPGPRTPSGPPPEYEDPPPPSWLVKEAGAPSPDPSEAPDGAAP